MTSTGIRELLFTPGEFFETHPAAMLVVAPTGRIVFWNAASERLLGWTAADLVGREFELIIVSTTAAREQRTRLLDRVKDKGSASFESERRHKDGHAVAVRGTYDAGIGVYSGYSFCEMREANGAEAPVAAAEGNGDRSHTLTSRQRQVLKLMAEGRSTREIAGKLDLSVKTIETHRGHLMQRLKLRSVAGLVRYAVSIGLVPASPWSRGS